MGQSPFFMSPRRGSSIAAPGLLAMGITSASENSSVHSGFASDRFTFTDQAHNAARVVRRAASDRITFTDKAYRDRTYAVAASDSATFSEREFAVNRGHHASDRFTFTDQAITALYLGRYRRGDTVMLDFSVPIVLDVTPIVVVTTNFSRQLAAFAVPALTRDRLNYGLPLFIGQPYSIGSFTVYFYFTANGVAGLKSATFDVVTGGDSGGAVISMYGVERPEARSIIAQLSSGRLVLGSNPRLN